MVEVTKGLRAGEKVASSANFLIDSEAKLKGIAPSKP
jgi:Cu(I)/Ag(I) efflux system membrane fusion protein